jgi:hypothetical protein
MSTDHKPSRESILAVLIEAGKAPEEINFSLQLAGHAGLTPLELAGIQGTTLSKPAQDEIAQAAKEASEEAAAKVDPVKQAAKAALHGQTPPGSLRAKLLQVVGNKNGKPVRNVDAMISGTCHQIVDVMKVLSPEAYKQYHEIKYPGGMESMATEETKRAAYLFAFAFMYDHFKL